MTAAAVNGGAACAHAAADIEDRACTCVGTPCSVGTVGADYEYTFVGHGDCRGPDVAQHVNSRVKRLSRTMLVNGVNQSDASANDAECASACTLYPACVGYAVVSGEGPHPDDLGICYVYGPTLDVGLAPYAPPGSTTAWQAYSQPISEVASSSLIELPSGSDPTIFNGLACRKKTGAQLRTTSDTITSTSFSECMSLSLSLPSVYR